MTTRAPATVLRIYETLADAYGPQGWWPADTRTEMVIGAILTQNTAWANVEKAILAMKRAGCLSFPVIHGLELDALGEVIRSAGTYRVKAARLKAFARWFIEERGGDWENVFEGELHRNREALLGIAGIGPETADAILLYAGRRPSFVIDAYARRIMRRHHVLSGNPAYDEVKETMEDSLPRDVALYNEFHALLVEVGKRHCRARASCENCPLEAFPHDGSL